jgi:hypothetical protein
MKGREERSGKALEGRVRSAGSEGKEGRKEGVGGELVGGNGNVI